MATGNLVISGTDDQLVAHGGSYQAVRTYNSQGLLNDDNSDNWSTGFYRRQLVLAGQAGQQGSTITLIGRDGGGALFTWDAASSRYVGTDGAGAYDRIESTGSGFIWTDGQTQTRDYYAADTGRLDKTVDANGNTTTYTYGADGNIAKVVNASGESVVYDYAGGLLMRVRVADRQDATTVRTSYAYDARNRLASVTVDLTPADGSTADGKIYRTSYTYDGDSNRVATVSQSDGTQLAIQYVQVGADYKVASLRDALGQTYRFSYDTAARTTQVTDPAGKNVSYAYDAKGQLLSIASPGTGGAPLVQRFEYNATGDLIRTTDADGRAVFMAYDARGNQVLQRDALGNTVARTYNAVNQLLTETVYTQPDPDGDGAGQPSGALTTRYVYDDANGTNLRFVISAEGRVTEYRRNAYGEVVAVLQHHASAYAVAGLARDAVPTAATVASWAGQQNLQQVRRTDYVLDFRGQVQTSTTYSATDASGNGVAAGSTVVRQVYDPAGRLIQTIDGKGATTAYAYDGMGRLLSTTDGLGQLASTLYDDAGARIVNQAVNGLQETRTYDRAGRLVSLQRSDATAADLGTSTFVYDALGRLRLSQDATGVKSWMLYDDAGRKTADVGAAGELREYIYNGSGQLTRTIAYATPVDTRLLTAGDGSLADIAVAALRPAGAPSDRTEWSIYDGAGRLWKTVGSDGSVTENVYDGASRLVTTRQYAKTVAVASLGGTPAGSAVSPVADAAADRVTRYFYDADGLRTGTLDAEGYLLLNAYDAAGRLASTTRFAKLTDAAKRASGTLQDLKPATNSQDIVERRVYDEKHQLVALVDGASYLTTFEYDANGNATKQTRYATALKAAVVSSITSATPVAQLRPAASGQDQVRLSEYDALGRLAAETDYQGTRTEHAYDAAGNRIRTTVATGSEARARVSRYDAQGRLLAELSAEGARQLASAQTQAQIDAVWNSYAKTHTYDRAGRRTSTTDTNGLRTLFFYNTAGQLTHTVNALGEVTETRYSALGQATAQVRYGTRINPGELTGSQAGGLVNAKLLSLLQAAANPALDQITRSTYNATGTLASTTDALGFATNYVYNAFREETQRTEPTGVSTPNTVLQTRYDRRGLVAGQTRDAGALAAVTAYKYDAFGNQISATDALGRVRTRTFDKLGREVSSTNALWAVLTTKYDAFNRIVSQVNAEGNTTTYAYDAKNRTVTISTDEGLLLKQTYNRHGDMVQVSDARGNATSYTYDADGNPTGASAQAWRFDTNVTETVTTSKSYDRAGRLMETVDANGTRTTVAYDAANRVITQTVDAGGLSLATQFAYDPLGRQIRITQPGGTVTELRYDAKGQLTEQLVDPAGLALSTRYAYDAQGHTLEVTRPEGTLTRYSYDGLGRRVREQVDPAGLNLTRLYTYDLQGNLTSSVDANGNTSYYLYDDENRQTLAIDGAGNVRETAYDALGRISKLTEYRQVIADTSVLRRYASGGASVGPGTWDSQVRAGIVASATDKIEYRTYDANNHLQSVVTGLGEVTIYLRDGNGRVMEQRSFANRITIGGSSGWTPGTLPQPVANDDQDQRVRMAYDALGRVIVSVDGTGAATKLRYDAAGNVVERVRYAKPITVSADAYDESFIFQLAAQEGAAGNVVEKSAYDRANRLVWSADGTGSVTQLRYDGDSHVVKTLRFATPITTGQQPQDVASAGGDQATDYVYDAAGRQIYVVGAGGSVTGNVYDRNGNLKQRTEYATLVTAPTATRGAVFSPAIANYDQANIALALRPQAGDRTASWAYDQADRQVLEVDALGAVRQTAYSGNLTTSTAYAKTVNLAGVAPRDITLARVLGIVQSTGQDRVSTQLVDGAGRISRTVDAAGYVVAREYDGVGQLSHLIEYASVSGTASAQDRHTRYSYDGAGRLTGKTDALGYQESYAYDALGHRTSVTNALGATWTYAFDAAGRRVREASPPVANGASGTSSIVTLLGYDAFGNLVSRTEAAGSAQERTTRYAYDADGNQTGTTTPLTRTAGRYDALGRLVETTDANGVRTVLAYDAANRVLSRTVDPAGLNLVTTYTYDALGNALSVTDAQGVTTQFSYDAKGQLVRQAVDPSGLNLVTTYTYDAMGGRLSVTDPNGTVTAYQYDVLGRRVLEVLDPSTATHAGLNLAKRYAYNATGQVTSVTDAQGHVTRYAYDRQGRQRFVMDAAGNLSETVYDAAGRVVRQTRYAQPVAGAESLALDVGESQLEGLKRPNAAQDQTEHRIYDADNRVTATVNGAGDVVRLVYDANGLVTQRTAYANRLDMGAWSPGSDPQPVPSAADAVTRTVYDAIGRARYTIDATGAVVSQRYDASGNVTQRISYANRLDLAAKPLSAGPSESEMELRLVQIFDAARDQHVRYRYDAANRVTFSADGVGGVTQYLYDKNGNLLQATQYATPAGAFQWRDEGTIGFLGSAAQPGQHALYPLDAQGNEIRTALLGYVDDAAAAGNTALYLARHTDGSYYYTTDSANLDFVKTLPGWSVQGSGIVGYIRTAPVAGTTALYRLNRQGTNENRYTTSRSEVDGILVNVPQTSLSDRFTRKVYDAANRLTSQVDASGAVTTYGYDAAGNLTRETRYAARASAYTNQVAGGALLAAPTAVAGDADRTVRHLYDRANRETVSIDGEGAVTERRYNGIGQVVWSRQGAVALTATQLAALDAALAQQGVLAGSAVAGYLTASPAQDRVTRNYYDAAGRLAFARDALGQLQGYAYDGVGRLTERTVYMAAQNADHWLDEGITGYTQTADGPGRKPLYRLSRVSGSSDHFYTTDAAERDRALQNGWQSEGNVGYLDSAPAPGKVPLYRLRPPGDGSTNHYYTASEELRANAKQQSGWIDDGIMGYIDVAPGQGNAALYQINVNGTGEHFHSLGRAEIDLALTPQPVRTAVDRIEHMRYDAAGNLIASSDAPQQPESTTTYDGLGHKTSFTNKAGSTWSYAYDAAGLLVQETSPEVVLADGPARVVTRMAYDALGHLTQRTEAAGRPEARTTRYEYDALGRQIKTIFPPVPVYQAESASALLDNGRNAAGSRIDTVVAEISSETRYDTLGNAVAGRAAGSTAWSYKAYDRAGQVAYDVDALGYVTGYTRNAWGETERLVRYDKGLALPAGGVPLLREIEVRQAVQPGSADRDILTGYDRAGRVQEVQEPYVFYYDSQTGVQTAGRKTTRNGYDAFGDLTSVAVNLDASRWVSTRHGYDLLGRRVSTTDALGYVTTQAYDAAGNLTRRVEFASAQSTAASVPNTAGGDRVTDYGYDLLNRKTTETRRGVAYTAANAGAGSIGDVLQEKTGDLVTQYAYDALGNLTRTTDAMGGTTYQYYDVLGRVRATITPAINVGVAANGQGAAPVNPLTEFQRDAHGNAVTTTQYASGATLSGDGASYSRSAAGGADRTSITRFDAQGHTIETIDADNKSHYYAYDAQGRLAKEWQNVTYLDDAGTRQMQSLWRAYAYDALGRQTHTYAPLQRNTDPTQLSLGDTELTYNAFGEVTRKRVLDAGVALQGDETYEYDNAGRAWRSNAGDGVAKVLAYNLQGQQTLQLVASGSIDLAGYRTAMEALGGQAEVGEQFRRTEMRYDVLGRLVQTLAPERASEQTMAITTRQNLLYGVISQSEVANGVVGQSRKNQVNLVWRSLQDLGSGDVRITLQYLSEGYKYGNQESPDLQAQKSVTRSIVVSAEEAMTGYAFQWESPLSQEAGIARGIASIQKIQVEKLDIFGNWATLYDVQQPTASAVELNWTESASPGYIWNEAGEGRKPIYRYYNRYNDTHLFSANPADREALLNQRTGWLDEGIAGYVAQNPGPGLVELYRLGKAGTDISVYTSSVAERNRLLGSGWESRGIDGYVAAPGNDAGAMAQQGMTKLYALQHNRTSGVDSEWTDGLYTTSLSERSALMLGRKEQTQSQTDPVFGGTKSTPVGQVTMLYGQIPSQSIEVSLPQDVVSTLRIETRRTGTTQWVQSTLNASNLRTFGSAHRIDLGGLGLAAGGYEYRVTNAKGDAVREVGTGTFAITGNGVSDADSAPPLQGVAVIRATIDGRAYPVLQWPQPAQNQGVVYRWRPQGSSVWTASRTVGTGVVAYGDGRTSGFGVGMQGVSLDMSPGVYEYEIVVTNAFGGTAQRAKGVVTIPQAMSVRDTTPPIVMANNNVTNLGIVGYLWDSPAADRKPLYRYYFLYQGNAHHISTADANVIAEFDGIIARDAAAGAPPAMVKEGILGYVQTSPTGSNQRLYQYIYGGDTVFRLTANPADVGSYLPIYAEPKSDPNFHFNPGTWYQNAYQNDGYISSVPVDGTTALYSVYNGNAVGGRSLGDYLTTPSEYEITSTFMLRAVTAATQTVGGVGMGRAVIDGTDHAVLQWPQQEAGVRVKITASPGIPGGTPAPYLFRQGDGRSQFAGGAALQGFVLDGLNGGTTYQIRIEIEHPASGNQKAYIARTDVAITVPSTGANGQVTMADTTPAYVPQLRAQTQVQGGLSARPVTAREYDRWGNVVAIDETQGLGAGKLVRTATLRYDANNQVVEQRRLHEDGNFAQSWASTKIYYDALGRQVGLRDANGNLNAQVRDLAGNVVQERHADGGRIDSAYNAFGDKVSSAERVTDSRTVVTKYSYDKLSRLEQTSLAQGISRYEVNGTGGAVNTATPADGALHASNGVDISGAITQTVLETNQYDEAGRKVRVVNGNNEATRYRYDRAGNVVLSGQETVKVTDPLKKPGVDNTPVAPLAYQMRYRYDALGHKVGQTDAAGMSQSWTYDTFGRLIGRTDGKTGGGTVDFQYAYNRAGDLTHEGNGAGKSLDYRYDGAGQRIEIRDNYLGQTTSYGYDLAGNRVSEKMAQKTLLSSGVLDNVVYQDNHLVYDAQNRLRAVFDSRADVRITYDLAGNRSQVTTHVINTIRPDAKSQPANVVVQDQQVIHTSTTAYGYDTMNRQIRSQEVSSVTGAVDTHQYRYDYAGNRTQDQTYSGGPIEGSPNGKLEKTYNYVYDDLNRMASYTGYGVAERTDQILYDGAGRQVYAKSLVKANNLWNEEHRYNRYDATGKLQDTRMVLRRDDTKAVTQRTDVAYHDADGVTGLGYDAAGNLLGNRQVSDGNQGNATTTKYDYQSLNGSYQQTGSSATRGGTNATTRTWRDANGFVSNIEQTTGAADERFNRAFVNDVQGNAVYVNQGAGHTGRVQNQPGGYLGGWVGDSVNPGHVQRQLVANGEVLARYGDAPDSENPPANAGDIPKYVDTAEFRLNAAPLKLKGANLDAIAYTVVGGETLKDIARNMLGDAKLWWRIAEANGLAVSGDGQLAAGQTLSVPKLALNANNVDTFQPYDPSRVTGSMDPNLPAPAGQGGGGCGGLGKIIMVVIAVVVTIYTAGAAASALGTAFAPAAGAAGITVGGTTLTAAGAALASGMGAVAGSIASQVAGIAMGLQDDINWKGVALSAIGGGIAGGLAGTSLLGGSGFDVSVARAAVGNAMSQGIGVVTGLQDRFDWKSVAASAVGAGVGWGMNNALGLTDANGMRLPQAAGPELFAKAGLSGFAAGLATAVARGGRVSVQQVATDAFGNALGESLAQQNSGLKSWINAFENPTNYGNTPGVQVADASRYAAESSLQVPERSDSSNGWYSTEPGWMEMVEKIPGGVEVRAKREDTTGNATLDEALTSGVAPLISVASWVHGGAQFASDQVWAIGNFVTGGWLSNHNSSAQDALARNTALVQSAIGMPRQISGLALRAVTGNWQGMDPLNSQQIGALNAKGDRLGAKVLAGQTALNIGGLAAGGFGAVRSSIAVGSAARTGAIMAMEDAGANLAAPRRLNSQFGGVLVDGVGSTGSAGAQRTVLSTSGVSEQAQLASSMIPGLSATQARALLDAAFNPNKPVEVVLGGSRVRSYFGEGTFRLDSDLDIGFNAKMKNNQVDRILDAFDAQGLLQSERGIRIFSGNNPPSGPIISPQEFFQRSGLRGPFPPERAGQPFGPSGFISFHPDGTITIVRPGGGL
ncbi:hypothetical protein AVTE2539_24910 [Acidovorax sp. SUPP2539]|nr:hypothetical protein AVTE2539_24910 [Acidovorax sp. SUPP2539]